MQNKIRSFKLYPSLEEHLSEVICCPLCGILLGNVEQLLKDCKSYLSEKVEDEVIIFCYCCNIAINIQSINNDNALVVYDLKPL